MTLVDRMREQLRGWRQDLINLGRRNRLLHFRSTRSTLEIVEPGAAELLAGLTRKAVFRLFEPPEEVGETSASEEPAPVPEAPAAGELPGALRRLIRTDVADRKRLLSALNNLDRQASQDSLDRGLWTLYLAVGMLEWVNVDDNVPERVLSPLLLVPVRLDRSKPQRPFELRLAEDDGDMAINPALAAKLELGFGIRLPGIEELEDDGDTTDLFAVVQQRVQEAVQQQPAWRVHDKVVLGIFSFHKEVMYRDLLKNEASILDRALIRALALAPHESGVDLSFDPIAEEELDDRAPPEEMLTILDADASQRRCIAAARDGHCFVMDGPPGTGKSQTIANVIAEVLARGQTVLFVSEKAAALDVVHARLEAAGIADFAFSLHSHRMTRRQVALELDRCLREHPRVLMPLDPLLVERLRTRRQELSAYAAAVNERRLPLGRSLFQVLGRIAQLQALPAAPHPQAAGTGLDAGSLVRWLEAARALSRAWAPVARGEAFLWREVVDGYLDAVRRRELLSKLAAAEEALHDVERLLAAARAEIGLAWQDSPAEAERCVALLAHLAARPAAVPQVWLTAADLSEAERRAAVLRGWAEQELALSTSLAALAGPRWPELAAGRDGGAVEDALAALAELLPGWRVAAETGRDALARTAELLEEAVEGLAAVEEKARRIARAFGLPERAFSIARMAELGELGELAGSLTPPEPRWLDRPSLAAAEQATAILKEHAEDCRRRREALAEVFSEAVLALDLERLCARFETVHRGWRRLLPAHFLDRRTVARCTRTGHCGTMAIGRLREALEWQRSKARLTAAERRQAERVGRYYEREDTIFCEVEAALGIAKRALELVGQDGNQGELERQLTRQAGADPDVMSLGRQLRATTDRWQREMRHQLDEPTATNLLEQPLEVARAICEESATHLRTVVAVVERVVAVASRDLPLGAVRESLSRRAEHAVVQARLEADVAGDMALLGTGFVWSEVSWQKLFAAMVWARALREMVCSSGSAVEIDESLSGRLLATGARPEPLRDALGCWRGAQAVLIAEFRPDYGQWLAERMSASFGTALGLLDRMRGSIDDISTWDAFTRARDALGAAGLGETADFCVKEQTRTGEVEHVIERAILERWVAEVIRTDSRLQSLRPEDRDAWRAEFQELDRALVRAAAGRVIESCNALRPTTTAGAAGIIRREALKKQRHIRVESLLSEAQAVVQAIKPCFMMSPLTVSQFLPSRMRFDVVIFDEASQVRPSDAINCIYRGDRLIVAGDPKQLPPTDFFDVTYLDDEEEGDEQAEGVHDFESLLDLAQAHGVPSMTLRWHYRSQHEDLITFSNYSFYDGRLLTFPGAQETGPDLGVELFRVAGIYRRGGARDNIEEARKVIERVLYHTDQHPNLSLGVVAFSQAQASAIQALIDELLGERPELREMLRPHDRLQGLFVKNLETVQGDQRDILIFSIGYGPDENGRFTKQLGPLSRKGGERRLNVAVTRARRRVEVVASVGSEDFAGELGSDGARHLKRYLDYAGRPDQKVRALAMDVATPGGDLESPFEEEIWRVIRGWGYEVVAQVGCAGYRVDLGVRHPERPGTFALGVECDGAAYHSSRVARDRDRLRQEVLEGLGWHLHRIWGPSWYRNRTEQESRLRRAIEEAVAAPPPAPRRPEVQATPASVPVMDAVDLEAPPRWAVPYQVASPRRPRPGLQMHQEEARADLCRMIDEVVVVEGPVYFDLALRRVRETWGVQRAGDRIRNAFELAVRELMQGGRVSRDEAGVLWVADGDIGGANAIGGQRNRVRIATTDARSQRDVQDIPPSELGLAVRLFVIDARSISAEELMVRAARLFGWNRRGSEIARALDSAVEAQIRDGWLEKREGGMLGRTAGRTVRD